MKSRKSNGSMNHVAPFAKRMHIVAIAILVVYQILYTLMAFPLTGAALSPTAFAVTKTLEGIVWFYLAAILFQFYRRTRLREYILRCHFFWLAGLIAYPFFYISSGLAQLFGADAQPVLYIIFQFSFSIIGAILFIVFRARIQGRAAQMDDETKSNTALWKQLLSLDWKRIVLLQFPANG